MVITYRYADKPAYGVLEKLSSQVRRIVARNPGPYTYHGTETYVIGHGEVAVIDPGPALEGHVDALLAALEGERITHQLITHTHADHSPASALVKARTGAPCFAFGPHGQGRFERGATVEAGADRGFRPDARLSDGDIIEGDGWSIECVHTPGHCSNHMCFQLREERTLFTGDHVMGWSTSVVSPPDGDMTDYMASLERLLGRDDRILLPAHGPDIDDPKPFVRSFIRHRQAREQQILACLEEGVDQIPDMVARMYANVPAVLHPAAARSVFAHVLHLLERGWVTTEGAPGLHARYTLA